MAGPSPGRLKEKQALDPSPVVHARVISPLPAPSTFDPVPAPALNGDRHAAAIWTPNDSLDRSGGDRGSELRQLVLDEQLDALTALEIRIRWKRHHPSAEPRSSILARSLVLDLGSRVLTHAARIAEGDCRRIVASAEVQASKIVQEAKDDVHLLTSWLEPRPGKLSEAADDDGPRHDHSASNEPPAAEDERQPRAPEPDRTVEDDPSGNPDGFFESPLSRDPNPWAFMNDDGLVGAGSGLLRRVLRRSAPPRQPPTG
jgi:hypothetical protein